MKKKKTVCEGREESVGETETGMRLLASRHNAKLPQCIHLGLLPVVPNQRTLDRIAEDTHTTARLPAELR